MLVQRNGLSPFDTTCEDLHVTLDARGNVIMPFAVEMKQGMEDKPCMRQVDQCRQGEEAQSAEGLDELVMEEHVEESPL